jgi:hypothetical protein
VAIAALRLAAVVVIVVAAAAKAVAMAVAAAAKAVAMVVAVVCSAASIVAAVKSTPAAAKLLLAAQPQLLAAVAKSTLLLAAVAKLPRQLRPATFLLLRPRPKRRRPKFAWLDNSLVASVPCSLAPWLKHKRDRASSEVRSFLFEGTNMRSVTVLPQASISLAPQPSAVDSITTE